MLTSLKILPLSRAGKSPQALTAKPSSKLCPFTSHFFTIPQLLPRSAPVIQRHKPNANDGSARGFIPKLRSLNLAIMDPKKLVPGRPINPTAPDSVLRILHLARTERPKKRLRRFVRKPTSKACPPQTSSAPLETARTEPSPTTVPKVGLTVAVVSSQC